MESIKNKFLNFSGKRPSTLVLYRQTDSTNERAKRGVGDGDVISLGENGGEELYIADSQSMGRGRLGRAFESPAGAGLYMSLKIKIAKPPSELNYVTPYAAVAAARVLSRLYSVDVKIKWVNDLYIGEKKFAGILTEVISNECDDTHTALVIGIGVNILRDALSPALSNTATSLEDCGFVCDRAELAAELCCELLAGLHDPSISDIIGEYRARSCLIGRQVTVSTVTESFEATVTGIGDGFELLCERGGETLSLISADVIRILR